MLTGSRRRACALLLLLLAGAACGRKTDPLVPDSPRPEQVKNITAVTRGAVAYLSWPLPSKNVEGRPLPAAEVRSMRISRAEFGQDRRTARYRLYAEIDLRRPSPASVQGSIVTWSDDNLRYGQTYGYQIRAVSERGGVSAWYDEVRVTPTMPLAIPKNLAAAAIDSSVQLSWEPVNTRLDGTPAPGFVGYNLYRGVEEGRYDETPLNKEPLASPSYKDTSAVIDRTYYYIVRAVDSPARPWHEGPDSLPTSATPKDQTPPDRPTGLTTVPGVSRVFLTWNENKERDLAGYLVYRSTKNGREFTRLTERVLNRTTYSDDTVRTNTVYYYVVTAVDKAGNESASSAESRVFVEKLR